MQISESQVLILGGRSSREERATTVSVVDIEKRTGSDLGENPGGRGVETDGRVGKALSVWYNHNLFIGMGECHSPMRGMLAVSHYDVLSVILDTNEQMHFQHRHCS